MRISSSLSKVFGISLLTIILGAGALLVSQNVLASGGNTIYDDALTDGWESWSWHSAIDFGNESMAHSGSKRILWGPNGWGGLYFHNNEGVTISQETKLQVAVRGSEGGQKLRVVVFDENDRPTNDGVDLDKYGGEIQPNVWKVYTIPVVDLNAGGKKIKGVALQENAGFDAKPISVDSVEFSQNLQAEKESIVTTLGQLIFGQGGLDSAWENWSWKGQLSSIMVFSSDEKGSGLYLHTDTVLDGQAKRALNFSARADNSNIKYKVLIYDENEKPISDGVNLSDFGEISTDWKNYQIPLDRFGAQDKKIKGVVFQDIGEVRGNLYINQLGFDTTVSTAPSVTQAPTLFVSPTPTLLPTQAPLQAIGGRYTTTGGKLYKDNSEIVLHGVNWFGFETKAHVVHGLWTRNYKDMVTQVKGLGFNSVRLPVCPATVHGVTPTSIDYDKNPDLRGLNSVQVLDKVIEELNLQEMYILLDHHTPDCQTITELWHTGEYSEDAWINDLKTLAERYKGRRYFMGVDLKNEPHGQATWASGNASTDWNTAAEKAGAAVLGVNPNVLVFVAGIQDSPKCSDTDGHFWGGNLSVVTCAPINGAKIPENKLVYTPHVYGPDVAHQNYFTDAKFPNNMPEIWKSQFGFLKASGKYAIVPGEWGGKFGNGGDTKDVTFQNALVQYFIANNICSSYYWSLNPNSGDTGGVLKDDWTTPWDNKVSLLRNYFARCSTN